MSFVFSTALFNVSLPLLDMLTDIMLIMKWYMLGHWKFSTAISVPILLNYLFSLYTWWRMEDKVEKKWSWIFAFFAVWKEYKAVMTIREAFRDLKSAQMKKASIVRETGGIEPFLEAIPTIIVLNFCRDWQSNVYGSYQEDIFDSFYLFYISLIISIISGSFGVTSFLMNGPYAILSNNGSFGGILTSRFIVALLSCFCTLFGKLYLIHHFMLRSLYTKSIVLLSDEVVHYPPLEVTWPRHPDLFGVKVTLPSTTPKLLLPIGPFDEYYQEPINLPRIKRSLNTLDSTPNVSDVFILILFQIIISIVLTFVGFKNSDDCREKRFNILLRYPTLLLISMFTFFTMGPRKWKCCIRENRSQEQRQLSISIILSLVNMLVTIITSIIVLTIIVINNKNVNAEHNPYIIITVILPLLLGGIFTILLFNTKSCNDLRSNCCFAKN